VGVCAGAGRCIRDRPVSAAAARAPHVCGFLQALPKLRLEDSSFSGNTVAFAGPVGTLCTASLGVYKRRPRGYGAVVLRYAADAVDDAPAAPPDADLPPTQASPPPAPTANSSAPEPGGQAPAYAVEVLRSAFADGVGGCGGALSLIGLTGQVRQQ
jgi:hypothetical protein